LVAQATENVLQEFGGLHEAFSRVLLRKCHATLSLCALAAAGAAGFTTPLPGDDSRKHFLRLFIHAKKKGERLSASRLVILSYFFVSFPHVWLLVSGLVTTGICI
jgi:hypothetical protein